MAAESEKGFYKGLPLEEIVDIDLREKVAEAAKIVTENLCFSFTTIEGENGSAPEWKFGDFEDVFVGNSGFFSESYHLRKDRIFHSRIIRLDHASFDTTVVQNIMTLFGLDYENFKKLKFIPLHENPVNKPSHFGIKKGGEK